MARPLQSEDASRTSRTAISPSATGIASCPTHIGTPAAISPPAWRSISTRSTDARQSNAATPAPTAAANRRARSCQAGGRNCAVAIASRRSSRAAIAAPRKATHRVRCCTNGPAPGIPKPKKYRNAPSTSGRSPMAMSADEASRFSNRCSREISSLPLRQVEAHRVARRHHAIECVGRHHVTTHLGGEPVDLAAPLRLVGAVDHGQAALLHQLDGPFIVGRDLVEDLPLHLPRRRHQFGPILFRQAIPRPSGHDVGTHHRPQRQVVHIRNPPVPLHAHGDQRCRHHGVDHPRLQAGQDVGDRQRPGLKAVVLPPLNPLVVARRDEDLHPSQVVDRTHRPAGEQVRPTAVGPVEKDEALRLQTFDEVRLHLSENPGQLPA